MEGGDWCQFLVVGRRRRGRQWRVRRFHGSREEGSVCKQVLEEEEEGEEEEVVV